MKLRAGVRLRSQVGSTEAIVIRAPAGEVDITCGGHPMVTAAETPADGLMIDAADTGTALLGKRYSDQAEAIEVLVTKPGPGSLAVDSVVLEVKNAKPLPSSD